MLIINFLDANLVEFIGYAASVLILVSLNMTSIVKLRWFNLAGAILFAVYGFTIKAYPVAIMNLLIAFTNIYNLVILSRKQDLFSTQIMIASDSYLKTLINFYSEDISKYYSNFKLKDDMLCFLILRNMEVAGIFIGSRDKDNLKIELDYAILKYRDFKVGNFLYSQLKHEIETKNIKSIYCNTKDNLKYISKMGFSLSNIDGKEVMKLDL